MTTHRAMRAFLVKTNFSNLKRSISCFCEHTNMRNIFFYYIPLNMFLSNVVNASIVATIFYPFLFFIDVNIFFPKSLNHYIISKSTEFEFFDMKLTTLKVDARSDDKT